MSNENSTINIPRRKRVGSNAESGRTRKFSLITYLNETQLKICLMAHSQQIRVYAYAYHDKDTKEDGTLKEKHCHLIIVTYNTCSVSAIRRWFSGYIDENGEITTTAQVCQDVYKMYDYLTHSNTEAVKEGKYLYDKSIVESNNKDYFKAIQESEWDNLQLATQMLLYGKNPQELFKIFGRDFIIHYGQIKQLIRDIQIFERIEINNIFDVIDFENFYRKE